MEEDWLGAPMFFASMPWDDERALLEDAGLRIRDERLVTDDEDGRSETFRWVFAQKR